MKEEIAVKISLGIPPERIMEGNLWCGVERRCGLIDASKYMYNTTDIHQDVGHRSNREMFDQCASRKHLITKQHLRQH